MVLYDYHKVFAYETNWRQTLQLEFYVSVLYNLGFGICNNSTGDVNYIQFFFKPLMSIFFALTIAVAVSLKATGNCTTFIGSIESDGHMGQNHVFGGGGGSTI